MLPPVSTLQGSALASHAPQSEAVLVGTTASRDVPLPTERFQAADAAIYQKLATLVLGARPGAADELVDMLDMVGKTLGLPRDAGEQNIDYALRLAEALKSATPLQRAAVEKLLGQLAEGADIKLLLEALKSLSGPAAARLVALMEASGSGFREFALRTVLASYGQGNDQAVQHPSGAAGQVLQPNSQPGAQGNATRPQYASAGQSSLLPPSARDLTEPMPAAARFGAGGAKDAAPLRSGPQASTNEHSKSLQHISGDGRVIGTNSAASHLRFVRTFHADGPSLPKLVKLTLSLGSEGLKPMNGTRVTATPQDTQPNRIQIPTPPDARVSGGQRPEPPTGVNIRQLAPAMPEGGSVILKAFGHGPGTAVQQAAESLKAVIAEAQLAVVRSTRFRQLPPQGLITTGQEVIVPQALPELAAQREAVAGRLPNAASSRHNSEAQMEAARAPEPGTVASVTSRDLPASQDRAIANEMRSVLREGIPFVPVNYQPVREAAKIGDPEETSRERSFDHEEHEEQAHERQDADEAQEERERQVGGEDGATAEEVAQPELDDTLFDFGYGPYRLNQF
ncbi:hypothetical protein [Ferirhizobium litorale]|uniref:Uncharacterized protein n=1 Tax=Ferirhizobium litorale TaxID=2927786 RepID=A0AAE3U2E7_9HYPH|nr:hypothetical protein [Fererhizobium litorale]MDI7924039.1 hypothetical protein [Fererhizobium litorale]